MALRGTADIDIRPAPREQARILHMFRWIWHVRDEIPLPADLAPDEAFGRIAPLFAHSGTTHARMGEVIVVEKRDQLAQDPLSVVDYGTLRIARGEHGAVLRYHLVSRALLHCFLAPLLFLAIGQLTVLLGTLDRPSPAPLAEDKASKDKTGEITLNPIDAFLGAPQPEKRKHPSGPDDGEEDGFSPTTAYVFAGIFAALWLLGRLLEPLLIRRLFRRTLAG